ncbi:VTT domain-containing protein [Paenibacillus alginolyticus]|uniref:VTT domain-containing protein n=1 Tax=Paenibacillus alginolyticus TaxID=59839 RepID=UPI000414691F|nr:VTT domain-containing protein [Paenibacillus alginolyticus]MCY9669549.1 VTT domain-containing protein [Paenibacillus alginolyticus]
MDVIIRLGCTRTVHPHLHGAAFDFVSRVNSFISGGLAFGPVWGTVYTIFGATMGAVLSFWLARLLGKKFVRIRWKEKWGKLEKQLQQKGIDLVK